MDGRDLTRRKKGGGRRKEEGCIKHILVMNGRDLISTPDAYTGVRAEVYVYLSTCMGMHEYR